MPKFSEKSSKNLSECHMSLQYLFLQVVQNYDCSIICGHRNKEDQDLAYFLKKSKVVWPNSNHNKSPSMAVDVFPAPYDWDNINSFYEFAGFVKATAIQLGIKVKWGGNFEGFFDGPHWELIDDD